MMSDTTSAFRPCATCGGNLRINEPCEGLIATIKDNHGEHHFACWGKTQRDPIASARSAALEEAAKAAEAHKPPQLSDWEDYWNWSDSRDAIAAAIRDLKDK